MATIKPIDDQTVHRIQSGQVIVDLCSVVKELVENSLDADATSIDVRFKNQGLDLIEVLDNGSGIAVDNYTTIALKHHTSKISTYADITTLQTFGFRGEALSSLCALSKFTILTCLADDAPKGTKLNFEPSGALKSTSVAAAQRGTTASVEGLFHNLPVRRKELERNIKREWGRVVALLQQYACVQVNVKFSVSQQTNAKSKKTLLFSTRGSATTRENIVNVFGAKTLTQIITLDLGLKLESTSTMSQRWATKDDGGKKDIRIIGYVSRPAYGEGRQTPDRQMFFVNSRPCILPQFAKVFNEVYKMYNKQAPFIFANILMDTRLYDVNVTPDKRTIMLHDQSRMLEELKISLTALFEQQDHSMPTSQLPKMTLPGYKQLTISRQSTRSEGMQESDTTLEENSPSRQASPEAQTRRPCRQQSETASISEDSDDHDDESPVTAGMKSHIASRDSMDRDVEASRLVSSWLSKKTINRSSSKNVEDHVDRWSMTPKPTEKSVLLKDKQKRVRKFSNISRRDSSDAESIKSTDTAGTTTSSPGPYTSVAEMSQRTSTTGPITSKIPSAVPAAVSPSRRMSPPAIPIGILTQTKGATSPETMNIATGAQTFTDLGETPAKRARLSAPTTRKTVLPSFGSNLSQRFSADGGDFLVEDDGKENSNQRIRFTAIETLIPDMSPDAETLDTETHARNSSKEIALDHEHIDSRKPEAASPLDEHDDNPADDADYLDEDAKKILEDEKVARMIQAAEDATHSVEDSKLRARLLLKAAGRKKNGTVQLCQTINTTAEAIASRLAATTAALKKYNTCQGADDDDDAGLEGPAAEEKLSLTIHKSDFANMKVIGQFNLGFILATRNVTPPADTDMNSHSSAASQDLFIIDQHASDEKYNFERLQRTTIVQSQRLVQPKILDLTAVEEEIISENLGVLKLNGFEVVFDESGDSAVGQRCVLHGLPVSKQTTFGLRDLEELIVLCGEAPAQADHKMAATTGDLDVTENETNNVRNSSHQIPITLTSNTIPRPSRVRKMLAMRACRSSIMIGRTLDRRQMQQVVRHMGEIDKPWNCPHGRPTMRHLCGLGRWDGLGGWWEGRGADAGAGDGPGGGSAGSRPGRIDWAAWVKGGQ